MKQARELEVLCEGDTVAHLAWRDGRPSVVSVSANLSTAVDTWLREGITSWQVENGEASMRTVSPASPDFLDALEVYITRQCGLQTRKLYAKGSTAMQRVPLPMRPHERDFWQGVLERAGELSVAAQVKEEP